MLLKLKRAAVLLFLFGYGSFAPCETPPDPLTLPPPPAVLQAGFTSIEEADLRAWVGFLASDELGGRDTGESGYDVAARFCALLFERYGLKPAGDGGKYFQAFEVIRTELDRDVSRIEVQDSAGSDRIDLENHLSLFAPGDIEWTIPWAFAGFGEEAKGDSPGDFHDLPLAKRVVMVLPRPGSKPFQVARLAAKAGGTKIAVISDEWAKRKIGLRIRDRPVFQPPRGRPRPSQGEVAYISSKVADRILRSKGLTVKDLLARKDRLPRFDLPGIQVRIVLKRKETRFHARNVVGLLEGSDPARRGEAVAIGAHLDHVGRRGDEIFRGADDNASGSSGVISLARAFAESPRRPARSILFLLFAAEERGLWGSRYHVDHPVVPLKKIMALINLDMIGRNEEKKDKERAEDNTNCVHIVGAGRLSSELRPIIEAANRFIGLRFEDDLERVVYRRSDQYNFCERGVPVAFFTTGFHPSYHKSTDTAEKINYPKMARIVRLVYATARELADRPEPLMRNRRRF